MNKKTSKDIFSATNALKVLSFLAIHHRSEFLSNELQKVISLSKEGLYIALRSLLKRGLVLKVKRGKFALYKASPQEPIIKQFKLLQNISALTKTISKLKPFAKKIILYGSASRGEDYPESDIDLFVLTQRPDIIKEILSTIKMKRKLQTVIQTPTDFANLKEHEPVFYTEIERGIILWEQQHE